MHKAQVLSQCIKVTVHSLYIRPRRDAQEGQRTPRHFLPQQKPRNGQLIFEHGTTNQKVSTLTTDYKDSRQTN